MEHPIEHPPENYVKATTKHATKDTLKTENYVKAIAKLEVLAMLNTDTPLEKIINDIISLLKI